MTASFGRYEPLFKLASGGMAEVHVARIRGEAGFEKLVAVKRMLPHLAEDERFVEMFLDEGRLAAHVSSPHVVQTLDLGRADDGSLYIVMELVQGCSLFSLMKNVVREGDVVPVPIAVEILAQAASGLEDAHDATTPTGVRLGIVHRDVSPQNVLVGTDGRARMTDFGIARAMLRRAQTSTGELKGKFSYFSPEQAAGKEVDRRTDVFALGVVAWELLASRRLFQGESPMDSMSKVKEMPITPPADLRADVSHAVSDAIMRALERDPRKRWQTAADFAHALREANPVHVSTREVGAWVRATGGEAISGLQTRLDGALAAAEALTTPLVELQGKSMTPVAILHSAKTGNLPVVAGAPEDSAATLAPVAAPQPAARPSRMPLVAGGLAVVLVLVVAVGLAVTRPWQHEEVTSQSLAAPPPLPVVTPPPLPVVTPPPVPVVAQVPDVAAPRADETPRPGGRGTKNGRGGHGGRDTTQTQVHTQGTTGQVATTIATPPPPPQDTRPPRTNPPRDTTPPAGQGTRNHPGGLADTNAFDHGI